MGKIKVLNEANLLGNKGNPKTKVYPVTTAEATFTNKDDVDEVDSTTPQGINVSVQEVLNSIRKKNWVTEERISNDAVSYEKLDENVKDIISTEPIDDKTIISIFSECFKIE